MYSYLINRIDAFSQRRKGYEAPKGIHPYEVKSKAAAGVKEGRAMKKADRRKDEA